MTMKYGNKNVTTRWNHIFNNKLTSNLSVFYTNYRYDIGVQMDPYEFNIIAGIEAIQRIWISRGCIESIDEEVKIAIKAHDKQSPI